jgi:hypothetical protein
MLRTSYSQILNSSRDFSLKAVQNYDLNLARRAMRFLKRQLGVAACWMLCGDPLLHSAVSEPAMSGARIRWL